MLALWSVGSRSNGHVLFFFSETVSASRNTPRGCWASARSAAQSAGCIVNSRFWIKCQILVQSCKIHNLSSAYPKIANFISKCLAKGFISSGVFKLHLCIVHLNGFYRIIKWGILAYVLFSKLLNTVKIVIISIMHMLDNRNPNIILIVEFVEC